MSYSAMMKMDIQLWFLKTADSEEELTCVGTFPDVTQGVTIEAEGQFSQHHIYGRQFNIQSYAEKAPEDTQAMERYLGSGAIKRG